MRVTPSRLSPDVLVIGLGAMGSATVLQLAERGLSVIGIDQYAPPHDRGSTHGESRITREAVGEGAAFVPLVRRSHQLWRALERESGATLFNACGGLILAHAGAASHMHEQADFLGNTIQLARQFGIPHECLSTSEITARFPQLQLAGDEAGYFEPGAGLLNPEACVATQLSLARKHGANIRTGEKVLAIERVGDRAKVITDTCEYSPGQLIVCTGPWLPQLLPQVFTARVTVRRQVLYWFTAASPSQYSPARFPIFIWHWGNGPDDVFYGFPDLGSGVKVATEQAITTTTPETVDRDVSASEIASMHATHVKHRLIGVTADCIKAATCLYTNVPEARFIIDRLPDWPGVIAVSACSGHGFKHSAAIGEAVATWVVSGERPDVLAPFQL